MGDDTRFEQLDELVRVNRRLDGVVIGSLVGFAEDGAPLVDFAGNPRVNGSGQINIGAYEQ